MESNESRPDPLDIEVFYPRSVEVVDPREQQQSTFVPPSRQGGNRKVALLLFLATCASTFVAGFEPGSGLMGAEYFARLVAASFSNPSPELSAAIQRMVSNAFIFSGSLMLILFAHEMGHYLQSRRYHVPASLPYFIPFPMSIFGTMGAVILQGPGRADRKMMFDIAITGPLAGLVFALPIAYLGVTQSTIQPIPPNAVGMSFGDPLILKWMYAAVHGPLKPGHDVILNPLLFAGWVGIFITALNLIPIGQLDGGHMLYTLIGRKSHPVAIVLLWGAIAAMVFFGQYFYVLIAALLLLSGPRHPPTADDTVPLGPLRIALGVLTLGFIVIGFTPTPFKFSSPAEPTPKQIIEDQQFDQPDLLIDNERVDRRQFVGLGSALPARIGADSATRSRAIS